MRKVELSDMIAWAKDRLLDDIRDFILNEISEGYATLPENGRKTLTAMTRLLSLPDDAPETLHALSLSYWNGRDDTFWESHDLPEGYVGPLPVDSPGREESAMTLRFVSTTQITGEYQKAFDGTIRRYVRGRIEETRRPGNKGYDDWRALFAS